MTSSSAPMLFGPAAGNGRAVRGHPRAASGRWLLLLGSRSGVSIRGLLRDVPVSAIARAGGHGRIGPERGGDGSGAINRRERTKTPLLLMAALGEFLVGDVQR